MQFVACRLALRVPSVGSGRPECPPRTVAGWQLAGVTRGPTTDRMLLRSRTRPPMRDQRRSRRDVRGVACLLPVFGSGGPSSAENSRVACSFAGYRAISSPRSSRTMVHALPSISSEMTIMRKFAFAAIVRTKLRAKPDRCSFKLCEFGGREFSGGRCGGVFELHRAAHLLAVAPDQRLYLPQW